MGIHYDYKSKRGERAMLKEAKRKERLALKRAKRASTNPAPSVEEPAEMHDISKPITLDDLTNPNKQLMIFNADKEDRREKLSNALKENIKKRKEFQKKLKEKNKNERPIG